MIVGIDIGGTKTHIVVAAERDIRDVVVASELWQRGGLFGDPGNPRRLVDLFGQSVPASAATPLAIGAHGCDFEDQCVRFKSLVAEVWDGPITVVNDAQLLGPAFGVDESIALIVGTGSIVTGQSASGAAISAGGHGWLLEDPGSAPGIAREAVRAVLRSLDEGLPRDSLAEALMQHYGVGNEVELSYQFTRAPSISGWAALATTVFAAANAGSALAAKVVDDAADRLAESVIQVRSRGAVGSLVIAAGGVISNQPRMFDSVRDHLSARDTDLDLRLLQVTPVRGALELAKRMEQELENYNRGGTDETQQAVR